MQAKKNGAKIIYADPRLTPTGKQADLYLPFYSGTDVAILNCFMQQILKNGWENKDFIANRTKDFEKVKEIVMKDTYSPENVSKISGIPAKDLITAAEWFGKSGQSAILYSMGITQHTTGVDNVKSIANIQMLTGNLGQTRYGYLCTPWPEQRAGRLRHGSPRKRVLRLPVSHRPRDEEEDGGRMGLRDCRR